MDWSLLLQFMETLAVIAGVGFGLFQLRQLRVQREIQGGAELLRSLQSPQTARTALLVHALPEGLTRAELEDQLGEDFDAFMNLVAMFEAMGPLVARGHVPVEIYQDYFRGVTVIGWRKVKRFAEDQRASGWTNFLEWFQWLAERMEERMPAEADVPAFDRFRRWRSPADFGTLRKRG